jgi:hypothetical protein
MDETEVLVAAAGAVVVDGVSPSAEQPQITAAQIRESRPLLRITGTSQQIPATILSVSLDLR